MKVKELDFKYEENRVLRALKLSCLETAGIIVSRKEGLDFNSQITEVHRFADVLFRHLKEKGYYKI